VSLKQHLRENIITLLRSGGALSRARKKVADSGILVLTLHRVVPDDKLPQVRSPRGMVMRESLFARLVDYLARETLCVAADNLHPECAASTKPRVFLTFDDGWIDNAQVAWPLLKRASLPMCIFMTTGFAGQREPFWPERLIGMLRAASRGGALCQVHRELCLLGASAPKPISAPPLLTKLAEEPEGALAWLKQFPTEAVSTWITALERTWGKNGYDACERLLDWGEVSRLAADGVSFGSHTVSHALLPQLPQDQREYELAQSRKDLQQHVLDTPLIAYPNGDADETVSRQARSAGYRAGFRNDPGIWTTRTDPFLIPRVNLWDGKLTDKRNRFSDASLEYSLFWKAAQAPTPHG
jgi:peptidoglycan/xylan/chitin deacetylase (PgdA/CDA1 family)